MLLIKLLLTLKQREKSMLLRKPKEMKKMLSLMKWLLCLRARLLHGVDVEILFAHKIKITDYHIFYSCKSNYFVISNKI